MTLRSWYTFKTNQMGSFKTCLPFLLSSRNSMSAWRGYFAVAAENSTVQTSHQLFIRCPMDSQLFCQYQHWCREPLPALVCSILQGRIRLSRAAGRMDFSRPPLSVLCVPSAVLRFRLCSGNGDKKKEWSRGRRDMGAGWGEDGLSRMWSLAWETGGLAWPAPYHFPSVRRWAPHLASGS